MTKLSELFEIRGRYMRSVNLERDGEVADSLDGYVVTPRTVEALDRVLESLMQPGRTRAWTLTGVYGTGKSSFANFVSSLLSREDSPVRQRALQVLRKQDQASLAHKFRNGVPDDGLVRAVVTGRREPIDHTIVRGLARGAEVFWSSRRGRNPNVAHEVFELREALNQGETVDADIPDLVVRLAEASHTGLVLVLDELGKLLEHAARTGGDDDLFLLQQLAELPADEGSPPVLVFGLLHQAFSEYGQLLSSLEQAEWDKIQGRFEDIPFREPADQMLRIMGRAIEPSAALDLPVEDEAERWNNFLTREVPDPYAGDVLSPERITDVLPLNPVAALVLPTLCTRYGQNDRSLFTFMASGEPHSLARFLEERELEDGSLPLLGLPEVYDYFIDVARAGSRRRVELNRWAEVQTAVQEARGLSDRELDALKVIGTLNLVSAGGPLRASRGLVLASLLSSPGDEEDRSVWEDTLTTLIERGALTYRQQVDEYRLWQGSDFDIDSAVQAEIEAERRGLAKILTSVAPLPPVVAQRHSYKTGTLRYFERQYVDTDKALGSIKARNQGSEGIIAYWVDEDEPDSIPAHSQQDLPVVLVETSYLRPVRSSVVELAALKKIERKEVALQSDGVARREVRKRISIAEEVLESALRECFDSPESRTVSFTGTERGARRFNRQLSDLLDETFHDGPIIWNELINRGKLTSQGAKAQREVITALLTDPDEEKLGIEGTGADYTIYSSLFRASGIHREEEDGWAIGPPTDSSEVALRSVWDTIEGFCLSATDRSRSIAELYVELQAPPYGVREGIIPILLAAVLLYHSDDVSVYQEGSFLPELTPAHFELLVKRPELFSVKHFELTGIRWDLFHELEEVLRSTQSTSRGRNSTLLSVVRPLVKFAVGLPEVTKNANELSEEASDVLTALLSVREPDLLVFDALPRACGYEPFEPGQRSGSGEHQEFRKALFATLRELQTHYDQLLDRCKELIHQAFGVRSELENLREDLSIRAKYLEGKVIQPRLRSFVVAATDEVKSEREWLESLAMIIADRPAETWRTKDILAFEMNVSEMARRFANLEALQKEAASRPKAGFEARRVTVTRPGGEEVHRMVWVDSEGRERIEAQAHEILNALGNISSEHHRQAVLVTVMEELLSISGAGARIAPDQANEDRKHG